MLYFFLLDIIVRRPIISSVTLLFILSLNWQYRSISLKCKYLQHIRDILSRLNSVLSSADNIDGLRELSPEVRGELLGELSAQAGTEGFVGHLEYRGIYLSDIVTHRDTQ